jgi:murein DD-endopeptidase MepM/ murein hydrolase activator NlpD
MAEFGLIARRVLRVVFVAYIVALHAVALWLVFDKFMFQTPTSCPEPEKVVEPPIPSTPSPKPAPTPSRTPEPLSSDSPAMGSERLIIPVHGVSREQLFDTFTQSRSEGRMHDAIDIPAPVGTPVIAAADGEIVKFHDSVPGGITIYQISADRKYFFYYGHLQRRADGLAEKQFVTRGTTIGYVGDTGNAGAGNYHLHFAISAVIDEKRFWEGLSINPYEVLTGRAELR